MQKGGQGAGTGKNNPNYVKVDKESLKKAISWEENEKLAELFGILLASARIKNNPKEGYKLILNMNFVDYKDYKEYLENLMKSIFDVDKISSYNDKRTKGIQLYISSKTINYALIEKGLTIERNKRKISDWIKKDEQLKIACLRGLADMGGNIASYKNVNTDTYRIIFRFGTKSKILLDEFNEICKSLGIRTAKLSSSAFATQITAKDQLKKFIDVFKPKKWEFNSHKILKKVNKIHDQAFEYKDTFTKTDAIRWKKLFEELGTFSEIKRNEEKYGKKTPNEETIARHIKKILEDNYKGWYKKNSRIIIDKNKNKITQFNSEAKEMVCKGIYKIFSTNSKIDDFQLIEKLIKSIEKSDFKRLAYLLNHQDYNDIIKKYFNSIIYFVQHSRKYPDDIKHPARLFKKFSLSKRDIKQFLRVLKNIKYEKY